MDNFKAGEYACYEIMMNVLMPVRIDRIDDGIASVSYDREIDGKIEINLHKIPVEQLCKEDVLLDLMDKVFPSEVEIRYKEFVDTYTRLSNALYMISSGKEIPKMGLKEYCFGK